MSDGAQAWDTFRTLPARRRHQRLDDARADRSPALPQDPRPHAADAYTYFIMVTSQVGHDEILEGMSAGADDYLVKPLDTDDLQAAPDRGRPGHVRAPPARPANAPSCERLNNELTAIARRDPLTGLGNRRALQEDLELLEARVTRYGHRYCMALLDVDHFKAYNDTYGHQAGDEILQTVAAQLHGQARGGDALVPLRRRRVPVHLPGAVPGHRDDRGRAHARRRSSSSAGRTRHEPARRAHDQRRVSR